MKKEFKIDPNNLKELVSQGVRISPHQALDEEQAAQRSDTKEDVPQPKPKAIKARRTQEVETERSSDDYESIYLSKNSFDNRRATYISDVVRLRLLEIMMAARIRNITVGVYIENIIMEHLDSHQEEIKTLESRRKN